MKKVLLLLANGFETYEASGFIDVISWNYIDGDCSTQLFTCGLTKEVATSFGQKFIVDFLLSEVNVDEFDALAIPGGFVEYNFYDDAYSSEFTEVIIKFNIQNKPIASVCVGSLAIGKSGVLNGRKGTTYSKKAIRQDTLRSFGVEVLNQPIVTDGNIITSWDPSTAIDVAFLLLEKLTTKDNANFVRSIMGFDRK